MAMRNPPHPGVGIRQELDFMGLTVAEAAEGLGVSRQQLYRLINGECGITPEMAFRLEKAIGSTADFWLRLNDNYELAQVRARADTIKVEKLHAHAA